MKPHNGKYSLRIVFAGGELTHPPQPTRSLGRRPRLAERRAPGAAESRALPGALPGQPVIASPPPIISLLRANCFPVVFAVPRAQFLPQVLGNKEFFAKKSGRETAILPVIEFQSSRGVARRR